MNVGKKLFIGVIALGLSPVVLANQHISASTDTWTPGAYDPVLIF
jgi:hypothetical protein